MGDLIPLALGVGFVVVAIILDALAYRRLATASSRTPARGIVLSVIAGRAHGRLLQLYRAIDGQH